MNNLFNNSASTGRLMSGKEQKEMQEAAVAVAKQIQAADIEYREEQQALAEARDDEIKELFDSAVQVVEYQADEIQALKDKIKILEAKL